MGSSPITPKDPKPTTAPAASATGTKRYPHRSPAVKQNLSLGCNSFRCSSPCSIVSSSTSPSLSSRYSIPFSWDQKPGIPKNPRNQKQPTNAKHPGPTLLQPPPARLKSGNAASVPRKKRSELGFLMDPFAVALMECSREKHRSGDVNCGLWSEPPTKAAPRRRMASDRFGFLRLSTSCKASCSVVPSTVYVPRSGRPIVSYSILKRRPE